MLYMPTTPTTLGSFLAQLNDAGEERALYYIIHTLVGYELNYTPMKKACLTMVFTTHKLYHYMLRRTM